MGTIYIKHNLSVIHDGLNMFSGENLIVLWKVFSGENLVVQRVFFLFFWGGVRQLSTVIMLILANAMD